MSTDDENKFQPAKLSDREREGQRNGNEINLQSGYTYGDGSKFNRSDKITKPFGDFQDFSQTRMGNFSEKNSSISRLDMTNKNTNQCGTAYNSDPIPETYKPATSNGVPDANAVEYKNIEKDRNA